jgi:putative inorganic carbon (HCO3(-)) transporter
MRAIISHPILRAAPLLALVVWAPLPFGSVTPGASAALVALGLATGALALMSERHLAIPTASRRIALALLAVAALGAVQAVPWHAEIARWAFPLHAEQTALTDRILDRGKPSGVALTFSPGSTLRTAAVWMAAAASLAAAALLGRSRRMRRALLGLLLLAALFQLTFGIQQWRLGSTTIWGVEVPNQAVRMRGTFVNPNHLATYLLIVLPALFAALWWMLRRLRASRRRDRRAVLLLVVAGIWIALFAGLAFTGSRAGMLAGFGGFALQLALIARVGEQRRVFWGGVALLGLAVAYVGYSSFEAGFGRLTRLTEQGGFRLEAMADTWRLFLKYPWTGVGLGAFRAAFPLIHPVGEEGTWWHAHNDWLELAATTGVVGLAIVGYGLFWLVRGLARSWREGERSEDRAAALAAIGACVAVGLQELLEFGLTQPANSFTLAVVCGAALAVPRATAAPDAADDAAPKIEPE